MDERTSCREKTKEQGRPTAKCRKTPFLDVVLWETQYGVSA